ncbi:MAG: hypothetical protein ACR2H3_09615, partial [Acidimicrobiales bacterium]
SGHHLCDDQLCALTRDGSVVDNGSDICPGGSATRKRGRLQIGVAFEDADATALVNVTMLR